MNTLKIIWKRIYQMKYYILLFLVVFFLFFKIYFPGEKVARLILGTVAKQTGVIIIPEEPTISFFPSAGIKFNSAKVKIQDFPYGISLGNTSVGFSLLSLLMVSPAININTDSFQGNVKVKISGIPLNSSKKVDELYLKLSASGIQLKDFIKTVSPVDIESKADVVLDGVINMVNPIYSDMNINVELNSIKIKESTLMGFNVPAANLKKGSLVAVFTKNELNITKLNLGGSNDELDLSAKGKVSMKLGNPYDITARLKLSGGLEKQFGSFLTFLPPETKKPDGAYNFRLKGDSKTPVPLITPAL